MNYIKILTIASLAFLVSCGPSELERKKDQLKKYKKESLELTQEISALEEEIAALDPDFARQNRQATLVTTLPVKTGEFMHYVEVSGSVASKRNVNVSAEAAGTLTRLSVSEGDNVRQGQLLAKIDDEILRNSIKELETSLDLAKTVFNKRENLWKQNIGTEIQYLEAKNNVESLERRLATTKSQLDQTTILAPFSGTVDHLFVKEGEMAQPGTPLLRLVGNKEMYIDADLSESYIGDFVKGQPVEVIFPSLDESFTSQIHALGSTINEKNRTFNIEVKVPDLDLKIKPNMTAILRLKDFEANEAVIVPTKLIQRDNQGEYVYVVNDSDGKQVAEKREVQTGITYKNETLIENGLTGQELLIDEGFREVAEGHAIKEVENTI